MNKTYIEITVVNMNNDYILKNYNASKNIWFDLIFTKSGHYKYRYFGTPSFARYYGLYYAYQNQCLKLWEYI